MPVKASDLVVSSLMVVDGRYRPYFENYTVDASILKMHTNKSLRVNVVCVTNYLAPFPGCQVTHVISIF